MELFKYDQNNNISFDEIEKKLGFKVHSDLKEFYNKNLFESFEYDIDTDDLSPISASDNFEEFESPIYCEITGNKHDGKLVRDPEHFFLYGFNQQTIYGDLWEHADRVNMYWLGLLFDSGRDNMGILFNNSNGMIECWDYNGADDWRDTPKCMLFANLKDFLKCLKPSKD